MYVQEGSCILIREDKKCIVKNRDDLKIFNEELIFEGSAIELVTINTIIISIYRAPYLATVEIFLSKLENLLLKLKKEKYCNSYRL